MEKTTFFEDYKNLMISFEALKKSEANPFFKSKYVPLNQILPIVKEKCAENNFIVYQYPKTAEGKTILTTVIEHKDGRKMEGDVEIISKDPNDPQKLGAGLTYMRRYSLTCMFGLQEEDDDGQRASTPYKPKPATVTAKPLLWTKIKKATGKDNPTEQEIIKAVGDNSGIIIKSKEDLNEEACKLIIGMWK